MFRNVMVWHKQLFHEYLPHFTGLRSYWLVCVPWKVSKWSSRQKVNIPLSKISPLFQESQKTFTPYTFSLIWTISCGKSHPTSKNSWVGMDSLFVGRLHWFAIGTNKVGKNNFGEQLTFLTIWFLIIFFLFKLLMIDNSIDFDPKSGRMTKQQLKIIGWFKENSTSIAPGGPWCQTPKSFRIIKNLWPWWCEIDKPLSPFSKRKFDFPYLKYTKRQKNIILPEYFLLHIYIGIKILLNLLT